MNFSDFSQFVWISPLTNCYMGVMTASLIFCRWCYTNSENTCRITGFYEMWCPTTQTKSLWDKWEIYNQKWYYTKLT